MMTRSSSSETKPMSSDRLKKRELMIMTGFLVLEHGPLFTDLEREEPLRPHHQDRDDRKQRDDLGHRARQEEFERRLRLRDGEGRGDGAEQAGRTAEHHDEEGIDDVELAGGGPGRADHGEGRASAT